MIIIDIGRRAAPFHADVVCVGIPVITKSLQTSTQNSIAIAKDYGKTKVHKSIGRFYVQFLQPDSVT